jgi:hypothetical protein
MGTEAPKAAAAPVPESVPVVNTDDLIELCRKRWDAFEAQQSRDAASLNEISERLTWDEMKVITRVIDVQYGTLLAEEAWRLAELARHFPAFAPALLMTWADIETAAYGKPGTCCRPESGYGA